MYLVPKYYVTDYVLSGLMNIFRLDFIQVNFIAFDGIIYNNFR